MLLSFVCAYYPLQIIPSRYAERESLCLFTNKDSLIQSSNAKLFQTKPSLQITEYTPHIHTEREREILRCDQICLHTGEDHSI